ncbi:MAG TPA: efflux RND transporter periplasmic adaptor subunit, partial [Polyangiaceae bacterium]
RGVELSNDAAGIVSKIAFESGQSVRQGQILVELNSDVERAQLTSLRAKVKLAQVSLERSKKLAGSGAVTQSQLDEDQSTFDSLVAEEAALKAQIERKIVRAPFAGRLGIRAVNKGQYLPPGTTVTVLETTESSYVDFTLPQQELSKIKEGMRVRLLSEQKGAPPVEGTISAIDPSVDAVTRAVKVRATVPNETGLRSGMFANVQIILPEKRTVVAVPQTAIVHATYGDSVFRVETRKEPGPDGKPVKVARQQFVRIGGERGDFVAIEQGVKAGEEIVAAGAFKLRNGSTVVVNNGVKLDPQLAPRVDNR